MNTGIRTKNRNLPRAVILTALRVEYLAVRAHLTHLKEELHKGTIYERGTFSSNGQLWEVGIAEIGEGNEQAALEVERAIQYFNPSIILFVGVAGGIKDVKLGDVVVATKVYDYESGKADDTFKTRPDLDKPKPGMVNRAKAEARKDDWLRRLGDSTQDSLPHIYVGPIAAGGKLLNSTRSAVYKLIKSNYNDTLAVEKEGYGFLKGAYANQQVDALVIRGISDLLDDKEEADRAGYQEIASRHASAFAFEILAKLHSQKIGQSTNIIQSGEKQIEKYRTIDYRKFERQLPGLRCFTKENIENAKSFFCSSYLYNKTYGTSDTPYPIIDNDLVLDIKTHVLQYLTQIHCFHP